MGDGLITSIPPDPAAVTGLRRRLADDAAVEDLCAKTFERVVAKLETFDSSKGVFEAWLVRIARNALIDHLRAANMPFVVVGRPVSLFWPHCMHTTAPSISSRYVPSAARSTKFSSLRTDWLVVAPAAMSVT